MNASSTNGTERGGIVGWALAAVPLGFAAAIVVMLAGSAAGWNPLWPATDFNLAELTVLRDRAGMLQQIRAGENPNATYDVRADLLRSVPVRLTPLQAAVASRELHVFDFLLESGARMDDADRRQLYCFAREVRATDIEERLRTDTLDLDCGGVPLPWGNR